MISTLSEAHMTPEGYFDKENYQYDPQMLEWPVGEAWTMGHIRARVAAGLMKTEIITPLATEPVTWQDVKIYLTAGQPIEVPEPHAMIWRNSMRQGLAAPAAAKASLDMRALTPGATSVEAGWNGNDGR